MFNGRENKVHYKSYKSGKYWVVKAIVTTSMGLTFVSVSNHLSLNAKADSQDTSSISKTNSDISSSSSSQIVVPANNSNQSVTSSTANASSNSSSNGLINNNGTKYFIDANGNVVKNAIENVNGQSMYLIVTLEH